jgi:hypothetical protein
MVLLSGIVAAGDAARASDESETTQNTARRSYYAAPKEDTARFLRAEMILWW